MFLLWLQVSRTSFLVHKAVCIYSQVSAARFLLECSIFFLALSLFLYSLFLYNCFIIMWSNLHFWVLEGLFMIISISLQIFLSNSLKYFIFIQLLHTPRICFGVWCELSIYLFFLSFSKWPASRANIECIILSSFGFEVVPLGCSNLQPTWRLLGIFSCISSRDFAYYTLPMWKYKWTRGELTMEFSHLGSSFMFHIQVLFFTDVMHIFIKF